MRFLTPLDWLLLLMGAFSYLPSLCDGFAKNPFTSLSARMDVSSLSLSATHAVKDESDKAKPIDWFWLLMGAFSYVPSLCDGFAKNAITSLSARMDVSPLSLSATHAVIGESDEAKEGSNENTRSILSTKRPDAEGKRPLRKMPTSKLAQVLDEALYETQWFVTGQVLPQYFCDDFLYDGAEVRRLTLHQYVRGVRALFDHDVSKAEILSTEVDPERSNIITCTWRVSGRMNMLWGMEFKAFIVQTDFTINEENGLIQRQKDRYSLPHWDIILSAFFPFLNGVATAPEAPPSGSRIRTRSKRRVKPIEAWVSRAGILSYFVPSPSRPILENTSYHSRAATPASEYQNDADVETDSTNTESVEVSEEKVTPTELYAYSDIGCEKEYICRKSQTCPATQDEYENVVRQDGQHSLLSDLVDLIDESRNKNVPWHAMLASRGRTRKPEIRAILADGTIMPAIRSPSIMDKAKLFVPDRAETRASLNEASRRAAYRLASR